MSVLGDVHNVIVNMQTNSKYRYYGNLLAKFKTVESTQINTMAVNEHGELRVNPDFFRKLEKGGTKALLYVFLHEALHLALRHLERAINLVTNQTEMDLYNVAADCILVHFQDIYFPELPPYGTLIADLDAIYPRSRGWDTSVETIYYNLLNEQKKNTQSIPKDLGEQLTPKGKYVVDKAVKTANAEELVAIKDQLDKDIAKTAESTYVVSPNSNRSISELTSDILKLTNEVLPSSSIDQIEKVFFQEYSSNLKVNPVDGTLSQRNLLRREFLGEAMMGRKTHTAPEALKSSVTKFHNEVLFLVDVSGSMSRSSIDLSMAVIKTLAVKYKVAPVDVMTYNSCLQQTFVVDGNTDLAKLNMKIGGGTNIKQVIRQVTNIHKYKLVIILTDLDDSPIQDPHKYPPITWLAHGVCSQNHHSMFGGTLIYINDIMKGVTHAVTTIPAISHSRNP